MCPFCKVMGVKVLERPTYIGAITHLLSRYVYTHINFEFNYIPLYFFYLQHIFNSRRPEDVALVAKFKEEFAEFKCEKCECECKDTRSCECECEDILECPSIWAFVC